MRATDNGSLAFEKQFTITVTDVNEAPTLGAINVSGTEDTTVTFTAANFTGAYSDPENTALVSITVATLPASGTLKLSGVNVTANQVIPAANLASLTYEPALNENGAKTFTVTASDGSLSSAAATVTMTLAAVNVAPSFKLGPPTTPIATLTGLNAPEALAFDGAGNLYVANSLGTTVSKFAPGETTASTTLTGVESPYALAFDGAGNLYVANYGGDTVSKFAPGATNASATLTGLNRPAVLAFDGAGNLYVANYVGNTVSKFAPGATNASATLTGLVTPAALAFDGAGNLYVANYGGNTVSKFAVGLDIKVAAASGVFSRIHATDILAGPPNEASQTVSFTVTIPSDKADLFTIPPAIAANGTLTFTPAKTNSGVALVSVIAVDSAGGSSAPQTFNIQVVGTACPLIELLKLAVGAGRSPQSLGILVAADVTPAISLATFHALEGVMGDSAEGRRLKDLYRTHGYEIIRIMQAQPALRTQMTSVMTSFQPLVVSLLSGRGQQVQITQAMTDQLNTMWNTMTSFGSPTLAATLNAERSRFNGFQDFVGRDFSQWAGMLQVPAPTQPWIQITSVSSTSGQLRLEANVVEADVALWGSTDLKNWSPVPGAQRQTNGYTLLMTDPSPGVPWRFYRVQTGP